MSYLSRFFHTIIQFRAALLVLSLAAMLGGCSRVQLVVAFTPEVHEIRKGERLYQLGKYTEADAIFTTIYYSDASVESRNTALYNLVCTRIITAKDATDFINAIKLLDGWKNTYPSLNYVENPNLMIEALRVHSAQMAKEKKKAASEDAQNKTLIKEYTARIQDLEQTINKLNHQIEALETIDQQLQEKKKPL